MQSLIDGNQKIGWNPAFRVEIREEGVYLFSESEKKGLQGEAVLLLAPLLVEGDYSADDLAERLEGKLSLDRVYLTLIELEKSGSIQPKIPGLERDLAAYCGLLKVDGESVLKRLHATPVYLKTSDEAVRNEIKAILEASHIRVANSLEEAGISLVVADDYLDPEISAFQSSKPWLLLKPFGSTVWLGPLFDHAEKACYQCLAERIKQNRLEETFIGNQQHHESALPSRAMLHSTQKLGLSLAITELFKWIVTGSNASIDSKILTWNTLEAKAQEHHVVKLPLCRACGGQRPASSHKVVLQSRKHAVDYRCLSAEETLKKFSHHVSPITGAVRYLEPSQYVNGAVIHVYLSGSNKALSHAFKEGRMNSFRIHSGGKGTTALAAKAGSLCESLERLSGEYRGDEPTVHATYRELGNRAIHPRAISLFSERQYAHREQINAISDRFNQVEVPFPKEGQIAWEPVWSLTANQVKYVPSAYCYFNFPIDGGGWKVFGNSNGCAAGNCLEEAILQGFFELVERDSVAIWWYNRLRYPQVDLKSLNIPYVGSLLEEYTRLGREVWVLDITTDLGIPSFAAVSRLLTGPHEKIYLGFGTHLDAEIAILRALTEMNQFWGTEPFWEQSAFNEGKQEKIDRETTLRWMHEATVANQPYLKPEGLLPASSYPKWESRDLVDDIMHCRKIIEDQNMEFLVLDQTRQEIGLNVVRVIVPGLRHFWARFAPGRLYDVPVKIGKLKAPLKESELNPIGVFL